MGQGDYAYRYTVTIRLTKQKKKEKKKEEKKKRRRKKKGGDASRFHVSLTVNGKVSRQCPHT